MGARKRVPVDRFPWSIAYTFCECGENGNRMEKIGGKAEYGMKVKELEYIYSKIKSFANDHPEKEITPEMYYLSHDVVKENPDIRVKDLSHEDVAKIQKQLVAEKLMLEGDLRKEITFNIKRLQEIGSYRGIRHKRSLPLRGQRTKTNARTRKGPRKSGSIIANKKAATKK